MPNFLAPVADVIKTIQWAQVIYFVLGDGLGAALTLLPMLVLGILIWKHFDTKKYPSFKLSWRDLKDVAIITMCALSMLTGVCLLVFTRIETYQDRQLEIMQFECKRHLKELPWYKRLNP